MSRIPRLRYKVWRSNKDKELHLLCAEGSGAFNALPAAIRQLGPWTGSKEGEINRLRLPYRSMLAEQDFVVIYAHVSKLQLETADVRVQAMTECPQCKGKARVPMHHGLRDKECPRCGGHPWRHCWARRSPKSKRGDRSPGRRRLASRRACGPWSEWPSSTSGERRRFAMGSCRLGPEPSATLRRASRTT